MGGFAVVGLVACQAVPLHQPLAAPAALVPAFDLDPDPAVVEVSLSAEVGEISVLGVNTEVWGYRDLGADEGLTVPGPLIDVPVGARLRVHLENALPESTTIHFHGIRLPNDMDGTDHTQGLVRPGETYDYDFPTPEAGTYWYHPHFDTPNQVWRGLYGAVRVSDSGDMSADRVFVLSDTTLDPDGRRLLELPIEDRISGRQGSLLLVNGGSTGGVLSVDGPERWRIVNACTGRFFTLTLTGRPMVIEGTDAGAVQDPFEVTELRLAPGDRIELSVALGPGETTSLLALPTDRAAEVPLGATTVLWTAQATSTAGGQVGAPEPSLPLTKEPADVAVREVVLSQGVAPNGDPLFSIDGAPWPFENPYAVNLGTTEIWDVQNQTDYDQSFHLHGFFFRTLDINGESIAHDTLEDTAEVPRRGSARFLIEFDTPGAWMFHTHVLDQAELGMMSHIDVN